MSRAFFTASHFCYKYGGFDAGLRRFFELINEHPRDLRPVAEYFRISVAQVSKYRKTLAVPVFVPSPGTLQFIKCEISEAGWEVSDREGFIKKAAAAGDSLKLILPASNEK